MLLEINSLTLRYGRIAVLKDLSTQISRGENVTS